jgi:multidrug efflux pump subunit AcrB
MRNAVQQSVSIIKADPGVQNVMGFTGGQGATNTGFEFIALKPLEQRKVERGQIINRLRPKLARVPGAATFLQAVQDIRIGGRQSNAQYQYTLQAETTQDLQKYGPRASRAALRKRRASRTSIPTSRTTACRLADLRPPDRGAARASRRSCSTVRCTTPSVRPKSRPSTPS